MITIKKLNKNYGKRRIKVFDDKTYLGQITTWMDWICLEKNYSKSVVKTDDEILRFCVKLQWKTCGGYCIQTTSMKMYQKQKHGLRNAISGIVEKYMENMAKLTACSLKVNMTSH